MSRCSTISSRPGSSMPSTSPASSSSPPRAPCSPSARTSTSSASPSSPRSPRSAAGCFRDLVIGAVPPAAFGELSFFVTPLIAAALVFFLHPQVERIQTAPSTSSTRPASACSASTGTTKAYEYGLGLTASAALGLATAVGGGVLRDVLANEVPSLLRWDRELYAVPGDGRRLDGRPVHPLRHAERRHHRPRRSSPRSCCGCSRCGTTGGRHGPGTGARGGRGGAQEPPR